MELNVRKTPTSRTTNLNYVNVLKCLQFGCDWFKNNQLLSQLTHAQYRDTVHLNKINKQTNKIKLGFVYLVYLVFLLCYCPYLITVTVLLVIPQPNAAIKGAIQLTTVQVLLNSSLNTVVFGWKMKEVRQIVKNDFKNFMFWKAEDTV